MTFGIKQLNQTLKIKDAKIMNFYVCQCDRSFKGGDKAPSVNYLKGSIMKQVQTLSTAIFLGAVILSTATTPASAVYCAYKAVDTKNRVITTHAEHRRGSVACARALKRCKSHIKWKQKRQRWGRSTGCRRASEVQ